MATMRIDYDNMDPDALGGGLSGLLGALRNTDAVESKQAVNIIEVISEGEIEGFPSAAGLTKGTDAYNKAALMDVYLALSGIAEVISPTPKPPGVSDDPQQRNFSFNGIQNTGRAGVAIPVVYGEIFTGSLVVSAGIDTEDIL